ncbi:MAG TPA: hypothetical protein VN618_11305 [Solirubrobacteraceae bacterium]|nr:hypothetical protein [Solirubrobacteraceae bacterium]
MIYLLAALVIWLALVALLVASCRAAAEGEQPGVDALWGAGSIPRPVCERRARPGTSHLERQAGRHGAARHRGLSPGR